MSYSYMLVSLRDPIGHFKELEENNIFDPKVNLDQVKQVVRNFHPAISWTTEDEGIYFGCTPCSEERMIEIWIVEKPLYSINITAAEDDAINIAKELNMTAIDVQTGVIVYSAKY